MSTKSFDDIFNETMDSLLTESASRYFYVFVQSGTNWEHHITLRHREELEFEVGDLRRHGPVKVLTNMPLDFERQLGRISRQHLTGIVNDTKGVRVRGAVV